MDASPPGPQIRGRPMIELLGHLDAFEPGLAAKVRGHVGDADFDAIRESLPTDWLDAARTRPIIDALVTELGDRAPQVWSSLVSQRLFDTPFLGGFFDMLVRLGGVSPKRFLKAFPRGWTNAYRGWGTLEAGASDERSVRIEFAEVAPYLFEHRQHWLAIRGVLLGIVTLAKEQGEVELRYLPEDARVEALIRW